MFKRNFLLTFILFIAFFSAGCTQHLGNFSALSTGTYDPLKIDKEHLVKKQAIGKTRSLLILGFPIGGIPKVDQAVSEALSQNDGDFMKNARLSAYYWGLILFGQTGYNVEGDVYSTQ